MNAEASNSHMFRDAAALQESCMQRMADMAAQLAPALDSEELEAAKKLAAGAWQLIEGLFLAQGMEIKLRLDLNEAVEHINELARM